MARKRTRREVDDDEEVDDDDESVDEQPLRAPRLPRSARPRPRRWRRKLLVFVVLVVGLVIAGPTIVAKTPLRNLLLSNAVPPSAARLISSDANFSWTGGQSLAGLTLTDATGAPIAMIESASVDRSLVALAANSRHLGKIVVTRPVVRLETVAGSSNVEDLVRKIAEAAANEPNKQDVASASSSTLAEIEIVEGTILGRDSVTGQEWRVDQLNVSAHPNEAGAWEASGTGFLSLATASPAADGAPPVASPLQPPPDAGRFKFQLHAADAGSQQFDIIADRLPLAPLEPFLARILPGARILGTTSADLKLAWSTNAPAPAGGLPANATTLAGALPSPLQPPTGPAVAVATSSLQPYLFSASGKLDAAGVRFTADALSGDLVELPTASLAVDAQLAGTRLTARQFTARSEWFDAEATGQFDLAQLTSLSPNNLPTSDATLTARVDLPQLTRMLPHTLQLRPGVRIDSGKLEMSARSTGEDAGRRWALAASVEDLLGTDGVRPIRWTQPIEAAVDLAEAPAGAQLKRIILRSPFASITADGAAGGLEGELDFNLADLATQLGQFVDLSAWQLQGSGAGKFSWRDTGADKFAASANLDLKQIDVRQNSRPVWVDPEVHLELQSSGVRLGAQPLRIETATANMRGPRDTLEIELLEPVDLAAASHDWFVRIKGDGPLDSWAGRLRPWVASVPDELVGQSTLSARLRLSMGVVELTQSQLSVTDFHTRLGGVDVLEKRIEAGGDFRWDPAGGSLVSQDLTLACSTVAARAKGVEIRLADANGGPPTIRGDVAFRGDLERVAAWAGLMGVDGSLWPRGQGVGRMQLASDANRASANLTVTAEPFTLVRGTSAPGNQPTVAWNEPSLQLSTEVAYTHADDRLQLTNLRLDGQTVKLAGAGAVDQLRTAGLVHGDVTLSYDSAELAKLLTAYLGPGVRIQGANQARLTANGRMGADPNRGLPASTVSLTSPSALQPPAGPAVAAVTSSLQPAHWSRRWSLTTEAGWTAANLYGLPIGAATITANIRDGQIQTGPLDFAVGQGRLTAQPRVLLDPPPAVLQLAAGPLVSNVAISTEVSEAMLKYAAPILANATRMSGNFSLITEGVQVPLDDPHKMATKGRLTMHQLSILPGPGLQDVVTLIQRLEMLSKGRDNLLGAISQPAPLVKGITMNERTIDVQVVDGRVYHRNLEFMIDDVPVTSYGSVGFDQTIALVIRVPVQAKWVGKEPALKALVGQIIEIPVSGTFAHWKVDERAVGNFIAQAAQTAVSGAIGGEIDKALDGLFRKK